MTPTTHGIDWGNLETGFQPGRAHEGLYIVRGLPGTGKTTFASGCPDSLLIDCDPQHGGKYVMGGRAARANVTNWDEFDKLHKTLLKDAKENKDGRRFKMVIVDPASLFLNHCRAAMCKKLGVPEIDGFDHGKVANLFREKLLDLAYNGYYWIVVDQLMRRTALAKAGGEAVFTEALLPNSVVKYLEADCHHILTISLQPQAVTENVNGKPVQRMTMTGRIVETKPGTQKTSIANPKSRVWLPEKFNLPNANSAAIWDSFSATYDKAVADMQDAIK